MTVPVGAAGAGFVGAVTGGVGWVDMSVSGKTGKKRKWRGRLGHDRLLPDGAGLAGEMRLDCAGGYIRKGEGGAVL